MGDFFVSADELWELMARGAAVRVFDVRRRPALSPTSRFIPGARWRDHMQICDRSSDLDAGATIVINCMHGHNVSQMTGARLRDNGVNTRVLAGGIEGWLEQGLPSVGQNGLLPIDTNTASQWVTRLGAKIDRVACPWLIRRFIDPDARFLFVEPEWVLQVAEELDAIAFDTPGAPIEHDKDRCSFDTLIEAFGLDDPALQQLALIVRGADTDHNELAPEAAGLLAVSVGNAVIAADDQHTLQLGLPVYDALYARLRLAADETHGWQPTVS